MRTVLVVLALAALALPAAPALASHVTCATPGAVCIPGALLTGWSAPARAISPGTTVVWESADGNSHPVGLVNGPAMHESTGPRSSATFSTPGLVEFHCNLHLHMRGALLVTEG